MSEPPPAPSGFRLNRHVAAALLLLLFETVPAAALATSLQSGRSGWIILALFFMAVAALPPAGIWRGRTWGFLVGAYVSGLGLAGILLRGISGGFTTVELALGSVYAVLFFAMHLINPRKEPQPKEQKPDSPARWLKENLEAIIMAFIMALIIRCFCIEVFKIPSSSMEPTLMGDHEKSGGDRIMVLKPAFTISPIERFDVIVFKFPLQQTRNFIKRVVGLPGEQLQIHEGNIFIRKPGDDAFRIARKQPDLQQALWIETLEPGSLNNEDAFSTRWNPRLENGRPGASYDVGAGKLTTMESNGTKDARFVLRQNITDRNPDGARNVEDVRIAFDVEITSAPGEVFAEIVNAYGRFKVCLSTEGPGRLYHHAPGSERTRFTTEFPLTNVHLKLDRRTRLELAVFDGTACVFLDGSLRASHGFIEENKLNHLKVNGHPSRTIAFGAKGLTFNAWNLRVGRDIHYRGKPNQFSHTLGENEPVQIPEDSYMVMGDNVGNSHDSRAWSCQTYKVRTFSGEIRTVRCEGQETTVTLDELEEIRRKLNLPLPPDVGIKADEHGHAWGLYHPGRTMDLKHRSLDLTAGIIVESEPKVAQRFIDKKFIVGKAFWVWWPIQRLRMIR